MEPMTKDTPIALAGWARPAAAALGPVGIALMHHG